MPNKEKIPTSDLAWFHNQKDPNFNPETGAIFSGGEEYGKYARYLAEISHQEKVSELSILEKHLSGVVEAIDGLSLEKDKQAEHKQEEVLTFKKEQAKKLLAKVMEKVGAYVEACQKTVWAKGNKDGENIKEHQDEVETSDLAQRFAHNALIDSINITNRFLSFNFGALDKAAIVDWQKQEEENKRPVAKVQRIKWSKNIICPDDINLKDRDSIAEWAKELYKDIALNKKWDD